MLPTGLLAVGGVKDLIGWYTGIGHPLFSSQHPDDHVWQAILGLSSRGCRMRGMKIWRDGKEEQETEGLMYVHLQT